jgi:DNA-binding transcriptional ArsR family regulator
MTRPAVADDVFRALSDPTRRKVLERLAKGPASVSELAEPFDMKLPSFVQHLGVLERSRLVKSKKKGRVRVFEINPQRLKVAEDWLAEQRRLWETRLDQLDEYLQKLKDMEENP